jgi:hypothetical protein
MVVVDGRSLLISSDTAEHESGRSLRPTTRWQSAAEPLKLLLEAAVIVICAVGVSEESNGDE